MPGIVVEMMPDFPAHYFSSPGEKNNAHIGRQFPIFRCHIEFTPRQRPNRHGRYHRAPGGLSSGTLSIPDVPQGWQRNSRASVIQPPAHRPKRSIASSP